MATPTDLKIRTSTCKHIVKELNSYEKEVEREVAKTADPYDLKQQSKPKTDTSAFEARNGRDIQGIPWERLNFNRDWYREMRLKLYKNYENLSRSPEELIKDQESAAKCLVKTMEPATRGVGRNSNALVSIFPTRSTVGTADPDFVEFPGISCKAS